MTAVTGLAASVQVTGPSGVIECEDPDNGYELHGDSFATQSFTHRNTEISGPWIEGTYASDSVRDNTVEALVVWVDGNSPDAEPSHFLFRTRLNALMACFDQLSYKVLRTIGDAVETWDCEVSDYTVETQQEFLTATVGVLRVQLSRRPAAPITQAYVPPVGISGWWEEAYLAQILDLERAMVSYALPVATPELLGGLLP